MFNLLAIIREREFNPFEGWCKFDGLVRPSTTVAAEDIMPLFFPSERHPSILQDSEDSSIGIDIQTHEARYIRCLGRTDSQTVFVVAKYRRGSSKHTMLGAFTRTNEGHQPPSYRVIAYGQVPCSADDSLDMSRKEAIDAIYAQHQGIGVAVPVKAPTRDYAGLPF